MNPTPIQRLLDIMARLRHPTEGCPWDREQDFATIAPYTIEEAYEVAEAIREDDMAALKDELGDLLFQVVFHAQMAEESGAFSFDDVVEAVSSKMERRHPHVFGDVSIDSAEAQTVHWETLKAEERAGSGEEGSELDRIPAALPALARAAKLQKRAARVGFDWPDAAQVLDKLEEEIAELRQALEAPENSDHIAEEAGDLLFACVNLARHLELDAETTLRDANAKFTRRFRAIEAALAKQGRRLGDASLEEMEELWQRAKEAERA